MSEEATTERVEIPARTAEGTPGHIDAKIFRPRGGGVSGAGPWPAVVFYMDGLGLRPALDRLAQRIADAGYLVLQPNGYWRAGAAPAFDRETMLVPGGPERKRLMTLIQTTVMPWAMTDFLTLAAFLDGHPEVAGRTIRTVGYCFGGRMALAAAGVAPDRIVAAASIHGSRLTTEEEPSPVLLAPKMRAELYLAVAERDEWHDAATTARLEKAFTEAGLRHVIELYPGTEHGFAPDDTVPYDRAASERHLACVLALFSRHRDG
ncbi:dienelactone hydrolase family protein [soil metagenome]